MQMLLFELCEYILIEKRLSVEHFWKIDRIASASTTNYLSILHSQFIYANSYPIYLYFSYPTTSTKLTRM
jgi:hypothetical protein